MQRGKPPEWWEKQKGSRGIRRGQWYRLVFQFPIRERQPVYQLYTLLNRARLFGGQHLVIAQQSLDRLLAA
ncbi:TPA: hypothetical protein HNC80_00030 [Escherichia coli]|nr:hypothetical protein [Escherichia coli]